MNKNIQAATNKKYGREGLNYEDIECSEFLHCYKRCVCLCIFVATVNTIFFIFVYKLPVFVIRIFKTRKKVFN